MRHIDLLSSYDNVSMRYFNLFAISGERHHVGSYEPRPGVTIQRDGAADRLARAHCLDLPSAAPSGRDLGRLGICLCRHPLERQGGGGAELWKAVLGGSLRG